MTGQQLNDQRAAIIARNREQRLATMAEAQRQADARNAAREKASRS